MLDIAAAQVDGGIGVVKEAQPIESPREKNVVVSFYDLFRKMNWIAPWFDAEAESATGDQEARFERGSADSHADPYVREEIRNNVRREVANNPHLQGQNRVGENDVIGRTPRIKVTDNRLSKEEQRFVKKEFSQWMKDVNFASKLRTQVTAADDDGEGIGVMFPIDPEEQKKNPHLYPNRVLWGYQLRDCDRLTTDIYGKPNLDPDNIDGVQVNKYGDPVRYDFLKQHPYDDKQNLQVDRDPYTRISSRYVFNMYRRSRPEQHRGVSQKTSSVLFAGYIRQYVKSVVQAMRKLASINAFLKTNLPPATRQRLDEDGNPELDAYDNPIYDETRPAVGANFNIDPNNIQCLPEQFELDQLDSTAVGDNHSELVNGVVSSVGRARCMPESKATGSAARYNYASVRQDGQDWNHCVRVEQFDIEINLLDKVFEIWFMAAIAFEGYLPGSVRTLKGPNDNPMVPDHVWYWDAPEHVDPLKEGKALTEKFKNGTDNPNAALLRAGYDPDEFYEQAAEAYGFEPDENGIKEYKKCVREYIFEKQGMPEGAQSSGPPVDVNSLRSLIRNIVEEAVSDALTDQLTEAR